MHFKNFLNWMYSHRMMQNLLEPFQSGLRTFYSTEPAVTRVVNDLLLTMDSNASSLLVLLDLSAAFHTTDHSVLLDRLEHYVGIKGSALLWFWSYLKQKTVCYIAVCLSVPILWGITLSIGCLRSEGTTSVLLWTLVYVVGICSQMILLWWL